MVTTTATGLGQSYILTAGAAGLETVLGSVSELPDLEQPPITRTENSSINFYRLIAAGFATAERLTHFR